MPISHNNLWTCSCAPVLETNSDNFLPRPNSFSVRVKRHATCIRSSSLQLSSLDCLCLFIGEPTSLYPHFPTRQGRNMIKGQLSSFNSSQRSLTQREPSVLPTSHPNTLDNALLQYPLLFPRCYCLGQWRLGLCNPGAQGRRQRRRPAVTELQHGQLDVLRFLLLFRGLSGIFPKWPGQRLEPRCGRQCPHWVELRCYWLAGMVLYPSTFI